MNAQAPVTPVMTQSGDAFVFYWPGRPIRIELDYFIETRGDIFAEILVADTLVDPPSLIHNSRLNLNAATTRSSLAKDLNSKDSTLPWATMLEEICFLAKRAYRTGTPSVLLSDVEQAGGERWLLQPYIEADDSSLSVLYADGGTGKSVLAMAMGMTVAGERKIIGRRVSAPTPVMYLDWEAGTITQRKRFEALAEGANFPYFPEIHYRRMRTPLVYSAAAIRRELDDKQIGLVIVDSLGAAADGPIEDSITALATCKAMASFRRPVLGIHHMPKDNKDKRGAGAMFGSVYYANSARLAWELKGERKEGDALTYVTFSNTKNNNGMLERTHVFGIQFHNNERGEPTSITVLPASMDRINLNDDEANMERLILRAILSAPAGGVDRQEIAQAVGEQPDYVSTRLSRLKQKGKIIQMPNSKWAVKATG